MDGASLNTNSIITAVTFIVTLLLRNTAVSIVLSIVAIKHLRPRYVWGTYFCRVSLRQEGMAKAKGGMKDPKPALAELLLYIFDEM